MSKEAMYYKMAEFQNVHEMNGAYVTCEESGVCVSGYNKHISDTILPSSLCDSFNIWRYDADFQVCDLESFTAGSYADYVKCVSEYTERVVCI